MISVTEKAAKKLKELIAKKPNSQNTVIRVSFGGFG
ncbi:hypothetical protein DESME_05645 [Desulfitobacterium metallireducens DSM 15288]|uniref:Uncharacterized protein n=1 Tax=Desulfitobacterium metallireducens DSM 15288 TaxID=871968 RepID=W0E6S5_9FIRM|nr:hypothetical protein DESME_05645 [Desulfitobacterium metallireducens DSM 15288]